MPQAQLERIFTGEQSETGNSGFRLLHQRWLICVLLTIVAVAVHGYHPYSEDAAIYVPAIKKQLDPSLYPEGAEFFLSAAQFSIFSNLVASTVRALHIPLSFGLLGWYAFSLLLLLAACWRFCELCIDSPEAPLVGTLLISALLTLPVAGTSLLLSDPYLTSRSLSTPALLLAVCSLLEDRLARACIWFVLALAVHPLMAAYGGVFLLILLAARKPEWRIAVSFILGGFILATFTMERLGGLTASASYRAAVLTRSYFFLSNWTWYEMVGVVAPLGIFAWLMWKGKARLTSRSGACAAAVFVYGSLFLIIGIAITVVPNLITLARYQPMRSFHLVYVLLFLLPVTMVLMHIFRRTPILCFVLIVAVSITMFTVQRRSFSATAHVEFPWLESNNAWQQAFDWVRLNTPKNAVFALEPNHMDHPGEDRRGFRAYAERSSLADSNKDGGVAALFPNISDTWLEQTNAAAMLQDPQRAQDAPSLVKTGATWMVTSRPYTNSLDCPYRNAVVEVCRIRYLTYRVKAEPSALAGENLLDRKSHSTDMTAQRNRSNY